MRQNIFRKYSSWTFYALFFLIVLITSCSRIKTTKSLAQLHSHSIVFPEKTIRVSKCGNSLTSLPGGPKFVVYLDSSECKSCQLPQLTRFSGIYEASLSDKYSFVVLVSSSEGQFEEISQAVKERLPFEAYVDFRNSFLSINPHFPSERQYRYFLVDKEGNVLFVGDPTASVKLYELFQEVTAELN